MDAYLGGNHVHQVTNFAFFSGCAGTSLLGGLFSSCGAGALAAVASLAAEDGLSGTQAPLVAAHGLSTCGSWALEHRLSSCGKWT